MLRPARDNVDNTGRHSRPLADGSLVFSIICSLVFVVNYWQPGFIFVWQPGFFLTAWFLS